MNMLFIDTQQSVFDCALSKTTVAQSCLAFYYEAAAMRIDAYFDR